jgi:hypothetical protein
VGNFKSVGDKVTVSFNAPSSDIYEIWVSYHSPFGQKNLDFFLNDTKIKTMAMVGTTTFKDVLVYTTTLTAGTNTFSFLRNQGYLYIDKFIVKSEQVITSIEDTEDSKLLFYPNPVQDALTIYKETQWSVNTIIGREVLSGRGSKIDMQNLQSGVYLIKIDNCFSKVIKK